jgi:hypothetical protein
MGVESEPLLAVGQSRNWWKPGGALGRWGWSRRRRDWSGGASSFGRWGRSEPGETGGVIGVVVLWSLRGEIGAVRSELKVAQLEQSVVGWEPKAAVWLEPKWACGQCGWGLRQ